jgi:hypothetical protein
MALRPCRECGKEVSTEAKQCPHCGVSNPTKSKTPNNQAAAVGCLVLIVIAIVIGVASSGDGGSPQQSSSSVSTQSGLKVINGDHRFGCTDRDYFGRVVRYAVDNDQAAFSRALSAGMMSGECTLFQNGERVYLTDTRIFSGLIKVRRQGETAEYWTNLESTR